MNMLYVLGKSPNENELIEKGYKIEHHDNQYSGLFKGEFFAVCQFTNNKLDEIGEGRSETLFNLIIELFKDFPNILIVSEDDYIEATYAFNDAIKKASDALKINSNLKQ